MRVPFGDAVALTRELVRIDSRNPTLVAGAPGEDAVARALAAVLETWGFRVEIVDAAPGRPNVVARTGRAEPGAGTLLFNGHLDVVGVDGMTHPPWAAAQRDGRIYGRGASDMKAGVAAMCAAAARAAAAGLDGELIVAAVVDEEYSSLGTRALLERGVRAQAAIVTEPTGLAIMPAHKGFVWIRFLVHGRAAHGSRWELGIDAIRHAGLLLAALDTLDAEELATRSHPLLGRPSLHASTIRGGTGLSTYPDVCELTVERRTIPGEREADVLGELDSLCARVHARVPELRVEMTPFFAQPSCDVATDAPVVRALEAALRERGEPVHLAGMSAWTDAALLTQAGIPAICFGPGDIALAHAAEEYVDVAEIDRATAVLAELAARWCGASAAGS